MLNRLADILAAMSRRERWLIAALLGLALPLAVVFGLVLPLQEARDAARLELADAQALRAWVAARAEESRRLSLAVQDVQAEPVGISGIEQSLVAARLRGALSDMARRGETEIDLRFDAVPLVELGRWINAASLSWGYEVAAFRLERAGEPGMAAARFTLRPQ